jgi:glycine oxidase
LSRGASKIYIAGGGVAGLCIALSLARRGAMVRLYDPGGFQSASAVAAGMVAPALEAAFDPLAAGRFELLRRAADRWPTLLKGAELDPGLLVQAGALVAGASGEEDALSALGARLEALGAPSLNLTGEEARRRQPGLSGEAPAALFVAEEWRLAPGAVLAALREAAAARGVELVRERLSIEAADAWRGGSSGQSLVIAAGAEGRLLGALAPELSHLQPIRGQILAFDRAAGLGDGPTLRNLAGGYVVPQTTGALAGGTMEAGRTDLMPDAATSTRLRRQAASLAPGLAAAPATARVGIRGSTPDGLPLVGRSRTQGVLLAAGMRRNGWLLAPLVADIVAALLVGEPPPAEAALFDPGRFEA